jgi:hypothetical protein
LQSAKKCELVIWSGAVPVTVAKGVVEPRPTDVDPDQLGPDNALVRVEVVMKEWTHMPLPVPNEQMYTLDDVRMATIPWPKNQIILDQVIFKQSISFVTFKSALLKC